MRIAEILPKAVWWLAALSAAMCDTSALAAPSLTTLASFPSSNDGAVPQGSLLKVGSLVYGTTQYGGAYGYGSVFAYDTTKKTETILYSFTGGADGATPQGGLVAIGSTLYGVTSAGGAKNLGTAFSLSTTTQAETILHSFSGSDGAAPMGALFALGGTLYGTASAGGASGNGTLFSLDPASGVLAVLHSFAGGTADGALPMAAVTAYGKTLYGTTQTGGANAQFQDDPYTGGTIFRFDLTISKYAVAWNFGAGSDGAAPAAPLRAVNSTLYGTTLEGGANAGGTIFSFSATTGRETILHSFSGADGSNPVGGLAYANGVLYGTTPYGIYETGPNFGQFANSGTVFSYTVSSATEKVLYTFGAISGDGELPEATPLLDGGLLLGTSSYGGLNGQGGILFQIKVSAGTETILHDFAGTETSSGGIVAHGSTTLLATNSGAGSAGAGAVLALDIATGQSTTLASLSGGATGESIASPLVQIGALDHGITRYGGAGCGRLGCGTIFSLNPASGARTVLYRFTGTNGDGAFPGGLAASGNTLLGTTSGGGSAACGCGTVFSFDTATAKEQVLYAFAGGSSDGAAPVGAPVLLNGVLWGTTSEGGLNGVGTIWQLVQQTNAESVSYNFLANSNDGFLPAAGLILSGSTLYGTTFTDNVYGGGTVFSFVPSTGVETVLTYFGAGSPLGPNSPEVPEAPLVVFGGSLIGTSTYGGASNGGTVFSVNPKTGAAAILWSFTGGEDGGYPTAPLLKVGKRLYGITGDFGAHGVGTLFELTP